MADIVRDILDKSVRQRKVIFQQKKPLLNYELNLAQDILKESLEEFTRVSIGDNYSGESLQIDPHPMANTVLLRKGTFYHKGVPISITADKNVAIGTPPVSGTRFDVVYALWNIAQSDSAIDPVIGFATTQEQTVSLEVIYESGTTIPTSVSAETITFTASNKNITLTNGYFPDWMRVPGTKFKTNAIKNNGAPSFTVISSTTNGKTIVVSEAIVDQTAADVRFTQYLSTSLEIPKEFRATKNNIIILAVLERVAGVSNITAAQIQDKRPGMAANYIVKGCAPYKNVSLAALEIGVTTGQYSVGGDTEFLEDELAPWKVTVANDSFNYVYLVLGPELVTSTTEPTGFHVMVAEVQAVGGVITNFKDVRQFRPTSSSVSNDGGTDIVVNDINSIHQNLTTGENLASFDLVYQDSAAKARKASAAARNKLPVIGMATQATQSGQKNTFLSFGVISNQSWSWVAGQYLYASSSGQIITASQLADPSRDDWYAQRIGVALSSKEIFFKPDLIIIKKVPSSDVSLVKLNDDGEIEVISAGDKINPDRLSFLATVESAGNPAVNILAGRYFVEGNKALNFSGLFVNFSSGTYLTSPIPSTFYNKVFLTLDRDGVVKMYEGSPAALEVNAVDPIVPDGELPLAVVTLKDNGGGGPGTVLPVDSSKIQDKRPWLNLGSVEDSAFQAIYRSPNTILVQQGEAWLSKKYITLAQNEEISVSTSVDGVFYFYLNLENLSNDEAIISQAVTASDFISTDKGPSQLPRRDYILLAKYEIAGGVILQNATFTTFKSRFWDFQDIPFFGERVYDLTSTQTAGSPFITSDASPGLGSVFNFEDRDFLEVTINGMITYEGDDYTKSGTNSNDVIFLYDIPVGASVRIRKI